MDATSSDNILEQIDVLYNKDNFLETDLEFIYELSQNPDASLRAIAAELLCSVPNERSKLVLSHLTNDIESVVRVNACDSISIFSDESVFALLLKIIEEDSDNLVRSYAVLSARDIVAYQPKASLLFFESVMNQLILKETDPYLLISARSGLYCVGGDITIIELLSGLDNEDYRVRCFTINVLSESMKSTDAMLICKALQELKLKETSAAVLSTLNRALSDLLNMTP